VYKRQIYQIAESNRIETFFCPNWNALLERSRLLYRRCIVCRLCQCQRNQRVVHKACASFLAASRLQAVIERTSAYHSAVVKFVVFFQYQAKRLAWGNGLRNDLFCVEWHVKPQLSHSINQSINRFLSYRENYTDVKH